MAAQFPVPSLLPYRVTTPHVRFRETLSLPVSLLVPTKTSPVTPRFPPAGPALALSYFCRSLVGTLFPWRRVAFPWSVCPSLEGSGGPG